LIPYLPTHAQQTVRATFNTTYDNGSGSLNGVACSNGENGLVARFQRPSIFPPSLLSAARPTLCSTGQLRRMLETDQHDDGCIVNHALGLVSTSHKRHL
ncbi:hypothetical protein BGY98DRAFT_1141255, partial [Russula aff. rugulosa BPL654]